MEEEITTPKKSKKDGAKIGAVIILVISAIVFIPAGGSILFESLSHAGRTPVFGSYKGQKIEYKAGTEFADRVSYMAELYKAYGQDLNQNTYYSIFTGAFEGTLRSMVYSAAVEKANWSASKDAVKYYEPEAKANFERCFTPEVMANMNWYPTVPDGLESMEGKTLDKMRAAK